MEVNTTQVHAWGRKDPLRGGTNDPRHKALALDASVACRVLHYACCSFAQLRRKYETLGAFPNSCVAGTVHHEPDTFHCKCRDAFLTVWKSNSELGYRHVDGVGLPKSDFHTGS